MRQSDGGTETADIDLFDSSVVHTISVDFDQADYDSMIDTFTTTGDKEWIRRPSRSTACGTRTSAATEGELVALRSHVGDVRQPRGSAVADPARQVRRWRRPPGLRRDRDPVELDGDGAERGGRPGTARSHRTRLAEPDRQAFTVNGGETELRLAVENPDEEWYEDNFADDDGLLYKADSEGDYSYRGEDPEAYTDVFDQEVGDDDMQPLIDFLDFINNADDATFAAALGEQLDVEAFATYLAFQDLIGNADDIDGRGNNSYLQFDTTRIASPSSPGISTSPSPPRTSGAQVQPLGVEQSVGPPARPLVLPLVAACQVERLAAAGDQGNVLVDRFMADDDFASLYATKSQELSELLFASGTVDEVIATWADVLVTGASDLVSEETVAAEAAALVSYVDGMR